MTLLDLMRLVKRHALFVLVLTSLFAFSAAIYVYMVMADEYSTSLSMYVLSMSEESSSLTNNELNASQMLTNDVAALVKSESVADETAAALGWQNLDDYTIGVSSSTNNRIITITVEGPSADGAAQVANELAKTTDSIAQKIMGVTSVNVVDEAKVPDEASGPSRKLIVLVAAAAGFVMSVAFLLIIEMLDVRVQDETEIENLLGAPVIGRFPEVRKGIQ